MEENLSNLRLRLRLRHRWKTIWIGRCRKVKIVQKFLSTLHFGADGKGDADGLVPG